MSATDSLAERFEADRARLRKIAYRLLGSTTDVDDAVQETWIRLSHSDVERIENLGGWLTSVVARVCLDMMRARKSREATLEALCDQSTDMNETLDLDQQELIAESVGLALLVVLDKLAPAERVAFVLHDVFDVPFEEIAHILDRTPGAARQIASRARRRVQGRPRISAGALRENRKIVASFLEAVRAGDMGAIVSLLDPNVAIQVDGSAAPDGRPTERQGAAPLAKGALAFATRAQFAYLVLVNGAPGIVAAPGGRARSALIFEISGQRIFRIKVVADIVSLEEIDFALHTN